MSASGTMVSQREGSGWRRWGGPCEVAVDRQWQRARNGDDADNAAAARVDVVAAPGVLLLAGQAPRRPAPPGPQIGSFRLVDDPLPHSLQRAAAAAREVAPS